MIKMKKFSTGNCNVLGFITGIKKELLNQVLDKLARCVVDNFQFIKQTWWGRDDRVVPYYAIIANMA